MRKDKVIPAQCIREMVMTEWQGNKISKLEEKKRELYFMNKLKEEESKSKDNS